MRIEDRIIYSQEWLKFVKFYKYLGLQTSGAAFTKHVKERTLFAIRSMADIQNLSKLPMEIAMKLFDLNIVQCYGDISEKTTWQCWKV